MHNEPTHTSHLEKKPNYIPMVIIAVILGLMAWSLLHNFDGKGNMWASNSSTTEGHESPETNVDNKKATVMTDPSKLGLLDTLTGNFVYNTGKVEELTLPNGTKLSVGASSSEAKLIAFLSSANTKVDSADKTKGWISLDRLYFETGKSTLTPTSQTQLKNIAAILNAFPNVALKLGGYTDNTGKPAGNITLSDSRAKSAMASLVSLGTSATRLEAEGYGQEHPMADNASAEGRALNRRIDVRVTKK